MEERIKVVREVKKLGDSMFIRLGKEVVDRLNLYPGAIVEAEISKMKQHEENERYVIHCDTPIIIHKDEDVIDCPICGKELHISDMEVMWLK